MIASSPATARSASRSSKICPTSTPSSRRSAAADCWPASRRRSAAAAATTPHFRGRTGNRGAACRVAGGRAAGVLRRLDSVVRRRRRRQVGARHDVAAARAARRIDRGLARRGGRARCRLVAERAHVIAEGAAGCAVAAALSGRAGRGKVVAVVSGGNIDLATFASLVGACDESRALSLSRSSQTHVEIHDPAAASRSHQPARRARRRSLVELASRSARRVPPARLHALARDRAQPGAHALGHSARRSSRRPRRTPTSSRSTTAPSPRSTTRAAGTEHLVGERGFRTLGGQSIAYFSAEFALHQSLPIYAGGLGVLAGRSLQGGERPRRAAHRRRVHVSAGLLPPARVGRRVAGGKLRAAQLGRRADRAGAHAGRQAVRHRGPARRSHGARRGLARAARAREAVPARHRSRRERAVGSRAVGAAVRRRPRDPHPAGNHPRHRRRARAEGARARSRRCFT